MNSESFLEELGENTKEESKQQASRDTFIWSQVHFQVIQMLTHHTTQVSIWIVSKRLPTSKNTTKQKAIVSIQKQPILFKTNAFPAFFLWKIPSPTSDGNMKVGPQAGVGFSFEHLFCRKQRGKQQQSWVPFPAPAGLSGAAVINQNQLWEM